MFDYDDYSFRYPPRATVAQRRATAEQALKNLKKGARVPSPVVISGKKIASTFWGMSWCKNVDTYSDMSNRLPRGRSYVRNGSVVDLRIDKGALEAQVSGSSLYDVK